MSCVNTRRAEQRGQCSVEERLAFPAAECSPMSLITFSVEPGESFRLSYLSNQNAWQVAHRSISTGAARCASSVIVVMAAEQLGQFILRSIAECHQERFDRANIS